MVIMVAPRALCARSHVDRNPEDPAMGDLAAKLTCRPDSESPLGRRPRRGRCIVAVEPLEARALLTNTIHVEIQTPITVLTAQDLQNTGIQFQLRDVIGTLTMTGENLAAQTVGSRVNVTGM